MLKSLDAKLSDIHANPASRAFILADAKDADMAYGVAAPGRSPEHADGGFRSLAQYRDNIRANVQQGLLDIMLMSVSSNELLTIRQRLFDGSTVTPAIRANDTTDIHVARGSAYPRQPSRPFRTAVLDHAMFGQLADGDGQTDSQRVTGANLGLYSVTFNNDVDLDRATIEAYRQFRIEAERKGFRHFLEIFDPNALAHPIPPELLGGFVNDMIARTLAGVPSAGRPLFLKMVYHGPRYMEELVRYDRHLVPGVLGGSSGTTYDAFKLLAEAKKHGARAALFGRKINDSEHQLSFIQFLRLIADEQISPEEAVKAYHGVLQGLNIKPRRELAKDMELTSGIASYGGGVGVSPARMVSAPRGLPVFGASTATAPKTPAPKGKPDGQPSHAGPSAGLKPAAVDYPTKPDGSPDFAKMTPAQRLDYHRRRINGM